MTSIASDDIDRATVRRTLTVRPFGLRVRMSYDDARFARAVREVGSLPAVGPLGREPGRTFTIEARTLSVVTPGDLDAADLAQAWPSTSLRQWEGGIELRCGAGRLRVDHVAGRAEVVLPRALLSIDDAARCFVEGAVSSLAIGSGAVHAVHSGLVQGRRRGLLLRGPSGAGKSTLSYACVREGLRLVSDDWVYGAAGGDASVLAGYPWRLFLVEDSAARFPELRAITPVPHPGADRVKVPVHPPVHLRRRRSPVDAVVFLDPDRTLALDAVDAHEARERFWGPALASERASLPPAWVDRLLDRPCYVLRRGTDPVAAARLLRTLAD